MNLCRIEKALVSPSQRKVQQRALSHLLECFSRRTVESSNPASFVSCYSPNNNHRRIAKIPLSISAAIPTSTSNEPRPSRRKGDALSSSRIFDIPQDATLEDKVDFVVEKVPVGFMYLSHIDFCQRCLYTFSESKIKNQGPLAEKILKRLELEAAVRGSEGIISATYYARVIRAWARTDEIDGEEFPYLRAKAILDQMIDNHVKKPYERPAPDIFVYDAVSFACTTARRNPQGAASMALELLQWLEHAAIENPESAVFPSTTSYNNVLQLYSRMANEVPGAAVAAEDLLMKFSALSAKGLLGNARPNTHSFNYVLNAWAASAESKGADRALEILNFMLRVSVGDSEMRPDGASFRPVIQAFAKRKRPEEATAVYHEAIEYFNNLPEEQLPVLESLEESGEGSLNEDLDRPKTAQLEFPRLDDLTACLNTALAAWSLTAAPDAPERRIALFEEALSVANKQQAGIHKKFRMAPDSMTYRLVVDALLTSRRIESIDRAAQYLKRMIFTCENGEGPAPDQQIFHALLDAYLERAHSPGAAMKAEELVHAMVRLSQTYHLDWRPNHGTFLRCMKIWVKQPYNATTVDHIVSIVKLAESQYIFNRALYKIPILFLSRPSSAVTAALVLENMPKSVKMDFMKPEYQDDAKAMFTKTFVALSQVHSSAAGEHAIRLLRVMQDMNQGISVETLQTVMDACSSDNSQRAADAMCTLLDEAKQYDANPSLKFRFQDSLIFSSVLEKLANVGSKECAERACDVLNDMLRMYAFGRKELAPTSRCLDACLEALCATRDRSNVKRATLLLTTMASAGNEVGGPFLPTERGIHLLLKACIEADLKEEKAQVQRFISKEEISEQERDSDEKPSDNMSTDPRAELTELDMILGEDYSGIETGHQFLSDMILEFEKERGPAPDRRAFHSVMNGWRKNPEKPGAAMKAEELLLSMIRLHQNFQADTAPGMTSFDCCILLWASQTHNRTSVDHILSIFNLAREARQVNLWMYRTVVPFLAQPSSAMKAAEVLESIPGVLPAGVVEKKKIRIARMAGLVVSALAKVGKPAAGDQALKLLRLIQETSVKTASYSYTSVVAAHRYHIDRREYAADISCQLLDQLKQADADPRSEVCFNDSLIFTLVLQNLRFVETRSAADRACDVLNDLFKLYGSGRLELEPTEKCLDYFLKAMCVTGDVSYIKRAVAVFIGMGMKFNSKGAPFLPSETGVNDLAQSCSKAGLTTESKNVWDFWNQAVSKKAG